MAAGGFIITALKPKCWEGKLDESTINSLSFWLALNRINERLKTERTLTLDKCIEAFQSNDYL